MSLFFAYVDPGFGASFYQLVYIVVFGTAAGWILKAHRIFGKLFKRGKKGSGASGGGSGRKTSGPA